MCMGQAFLAQAYVTDKPLCRQQLEDLQSGERQRTACLDSKLQTCIPLPYQVVFDDELVFEVLDFLSKSYLLSHQIAPLIVSWTSADS